MVSNSKELKAFVYAEAPDVDPCVRLLHAGGTVGCATRSAGRAEQGRLLRWEELPASAEDIPGQESRYWRVSPHIEGYSGLACPQASLAGPLTERQPCPSSLPHAQRARWCCCPRSYCPGS